MREMFSEISLYSVLWYILLYSFLGWIIEVIFVSANTGHFVNRGFLNGPVCPIYGFGGTAVILLLGPVAHTFLPLFVGAVLITSLLELVTGYVLNRLFHTRWWDYSTQPFNIGGYVCLKFSLAWGVAGVLLMRVLHPAVAGLVALIPRTLGIVLLLLFYAVFIADIIVTVNAILKLNRDLGELTRITQSLHQSSERMAESIGNTAITAKERIDELDIPERMEASKEKWEASKEKMEASLESGREKIHTLRERNPAIRRRLARAFPNMRHTRYAEALEEMKQKYKALVAKPEEQEKEDK